MGHLATISEMATRNVAGMPGRAEKGTEFQLHAGSQGNLIDFTEQKLLRYAEKSKDPQQRLTLMALIADYRNGHVAVAWRRGMPVYFRVTKDA